MKPVALPADPVDAEDFDLTIEALDRGLRARQAFMPVAIRASSDRSETRIEKMLVSTQ
jgi:hypothetical protein